MNVNTVKVLQLPYFYYRGSLWEYTADTQFSENAFIFSVSSKPKPQHQHFQKPCNVPTVYYFYLNISIIACLNIDGPQCITIVKVFSRKAVPTRGLLLNSNNSHCCLQMKTRKLWVKARNFFVVLCSL